jgi:ribosome-binding ATPase YchF (GTP1/OBG family)
MHSMLMETVQNKTNEIELLNQRNECINGTTSKSMKLPQKSEEYKNLELKLKEIKLLLVNNLNNFDSQSIQELNKHCQEQKRLVESATELKIKNLENKSKKRKYNDETNNQEENIDQINKSKRELIEVIDNFELTCIEEFLTKINTVKVKEQLDESNSLVLKIFTENPRFNRSHE